MNRIPLVFARGILALAMTTVASASEQDDVVAYVDKNGYFSFTPPSGWEKKEFDDPRSKVEFYLPMEIGQNRIASLFILAHPVGTLSPGDQGEVSLRRDSADTVSRLKAAGARDARFEIVPFCGVEAGQIDATLPQAQMHAIWFVKFDRSYRLSFTSQPTFYQQYLPVIREALKTFACTPPARFEDVTAADRERIKTEQIRVWIESLRFPDLAEEGERRLLEFGEDAVPALIRAQESGNAEQKERAGKLLQAIRRANSSQRGK